MIGGDLQQLGGIPQAMNLVEDEPPATPLGKEALRVVQLHARLYGRGPTKARSYLHGDFGVCVLEEIFTTAERTLIVAGSGDHVRDTRKKFQDAVKEEFVEVVQRITGRTVRPMISSTVDLYSCSSASWWRPRVRRTCSA